MRRLILGVNCSLTRTEYFCIQHHCWGGRSHKKGTSKRDLADHFGLYIFTTHKFHMQELETKKKDYAEEFCKLVNISYKDVNPLMNRRTKLWTENDIQYMANVKNHLEMIRNETS